jgi:diguanylate cyclase (GGDEF)-like protein/PAS domain S-box-containing protein
MRPLTLKTKLSLTVSLLVTLMIVSSSALIISFFNQRFKENIKEYQFTLVSQLARQLDNQIRAAQTELVRLANSIPSATLRDPAALEQLLAERTTTLLEFDSGVKILSLSGRQVAGTTNEPGIRKSDYASLDCFRSTVASGKPQISDPFNVCVIQQQALVIFTAPVFDKSGRMVAVLAGGIDLLKDNFLGGLAALHFGENGYLYIFNRDRTLIVHHDRQRSARRDVPPGANMLFDRAITGFEGTAETINSRGLPVLGSFKQLKSVNWIMAANYTLTEAHSPVRKAVAYSIAAVLLGLIISNLLIWYLVKYLTAPLLLLTGHIREISGKGWQRQLQPVRSRDETGQLTEAFNTMMESLSAKETELRKLSLAVEHSPSIVMITDLQGNLVYVNPKFTEVTGYTRQESVGRNPRFLKSGEIPPEHYYELWQTIIAGGEWRGEFRNRRKNGDMYWASAQISSAKNEVGEISAFIGVQEDITERKQLEDELKASQAVLSEMALHDNLTGLPNRRLMKDRLDLAIAHADRNGGLVGLLFLDVDHFKQINDSFGHAVGDLLLKAFGAALSGSVRQSDTVARLGGDEFIVMLSVIDSRDDAVLVARKILDCMESPFMLDGHEIRVGTSIGIAVYPTDAENAGALLRNADAALYRAKEGGRGSFMIHDSGPKA